MMTHQCPNDPDITLKPTFYEEENNGSIVYKAINPNQLFCPTCGYNWILDHGTIYELAQCFTETITDPDDLDDEFLEELDENNQDSRDEMFERAMAALQNFDPETNQVFMMFQIAYYDLNRFAPKFLMFLNQYKIHLKINAIQQDHKVSHGRLDRKPWELVDKNTLNVMFYFVYHLPDYANDFVNFIDWMYDHDYEIKLS